MCKHWKLKGLPKVKVEIIGEYWDRTGMRMKRKSILYRSEHDGELAGRSEEEFMRIFEPTNV